MNLTYFSFDSPPYSTVGLDSSLSEGGHGKVHLSELSVLVVQNETLQSLDPAIFKEVIGSSLSG
ncbi:hypothetical protein TYRP_000537 [Tyrophagus putrescentiae]|nr:hypothetical protein TYRP_000537 [Tyrophagus putrescentiae]